MVQLGEQQESSKVVLEELEELEKPVQPVEQQESLMVELEGLEEQELMELMEYLVPSLLEWMVLEIQGPLVYLEPTLQELPVHLP